MLLLIIKELLMLKTILLSVALATSLSAFAEPSVAKDAAQANALAAEKCSSGCLILSPADVAELEANVNAFAQRAFQAGGQAGYEKGVEDLAGAALKNPKICPKNT